MPRGAAGCRNDPIINQLPYMAALIASVLKTEWRAGVEWAADIKNDNAWNGIAAVGNIT